MEKRQLRSDKRNPIGLSLAIVVLFAGSFVGVRSVSAQGRLTDQVLVILDAADTTATQQAIERIEAEGGRIVHVFPTHVLIGSLPKAAKQPSWARQAFYLSIAAPLPPQRWQILS